MSAKEKGEGVIPSPERDSKRVETVSLTTNSIAQDDDKIKRVCENLREYASACRYGLSRGERYVPLPMRETDAEDFEFAVELLTALLEGGSEAQAPKKDKPRKGEPVGEFRSYAAETGCALLSEALAAFEEMRNRKRKPLTDYARKRAIAKLRSLSSDANVQAEIVLQSVDKCWDGFFALKGDRHQRLALSREQSSFETNEFFDAALAASLQKYG